MPQLSVTEANWQKGAAALADEFYGFVGDDVSGRQELLRGLSDVVESCGPFDGLMGFSEGGTVAATILLEDAQNASFGGLRYAVFFSAAPPFDVDALQAGVLRQLDPSVDGVSIPIPTAHIWSSVAGADELKVHESLASVCDADCREVFHHNLGHDVPGAKSDEGVAGALRAIERTIEKARV